MPLTPLWLPAVRAVDASTTGYANPRHTPHRHSGPKTAVTLPLPAIQHRTSATTYNAAGCLAVAAGDRLGRRVDLYA